MEVTRKETVFWGDSKNGLHSAFNSMCPRQIDAAMLCWGFQLRDRSLEDTTQIKERQLSQREAIGFPCWVHFVTLWLLSMSTFFCVLALSPPHLEDFQSLRGC